MGFRNMQEKLEKEIYSFHKEIWFIDNLPLTQKFWLFFVISASTAVHN